VAVYLAIDLGTSSIKTALIDEGGQFITACTESYPVTYPQPGWAEQSPEDWWQACCRASKKTLSDNTQKVSAVCISGQAPACVPIDHYGNPIRPAIIWMDRRAAPQAEQVNQGVGNQLDALQELNTFDSYFGGFKWLWFKDNEPEMYHETWKILQPNGFLIHKLTGEAVTDPGHAGLCTPFFSNDMCDWSEQACETLRFDREKLPQIAPFTAIIDQVSKAAQVETGIPAGTPVVAGAPDFLCACLGAGTFDRDSAALMLGTAGNLMFPAAAKADHRMLNTHYMTGGLISTGGVLAGEAINWFCRLVSVNDPVTLEDEACKLQPDADRLVFLPYLVGERSPIWNPDARGGFFGLNSSHSRAHLYRAVLEGVAFSFLQMKNIMSEQGVLVDEVIAINGGARSALWRQILADILGVKLRWRAKSAGTALGCAFLAGMGTGRFHTFDEIRSWMEPTIDSLPDNTRHDHYLEKYSSFLNIYASVKDLFTD